MKIVHLSSELAGVAKVGGLGDVVLGLAREQIQQGYQVRVLLPAYEVAKHSGLKDLKIVHRELLVPFDGGHLKACVWRGFIGELPIELIEPSEDSPFFKGESVYGHHDDSARFLAFNSACLAWLQTSGLPELAHLHDWPAAVFSALVKEAKIELSTLLTLHNVEHQGHGSPELFRRAGIDSQGAHSLLEMGLREVSGVCAVSKTYLQEIQTAEGGRGLDGLLRDVIKHRPSRGIINGIDEQYWNPKSSHLATPYSASSLQFMPHQSQCEAKRALKKLFQKQHQLAQEDRPLVACIARLVPQKGLDLIEHALYQTLERGGQFVILGTSPIAQVQEHFQRLEQHVQNSLHARVLLNYSDRAAEQLFASCDMTLIPSLFEPCGLTQLIGFRYGALAIARETGGLKDTVIDLQNHPEGGSRGNGFTFLHPDFQGLAYALDRALNAWKHESDQWQVWVKRVMSQDISWRRPASEYGQLYQEILKR